MFQFYERTLFKILRLCNVQHQQKFKTLQTFTEQRFQHDLITFDNKIKYGLLRGKVINRIA